MRQVLKVPVQAHSNTLAENSSITTTNLMTKRTADKLATLLLSLLKLGDSFPARVEDTIVDGEVEIPLISPNPPVQNNINDNYCATDPPVKKPLEDQFLNSKTQTVDLNVAFPAPYVTEQPQKKDISPPATSKGNKVCQTCLLCKSLSLRVQNVSCCQKSTCGRPSAKVLAGLALSGFKSKGRVHTKGRVFPTLQSKTPH